MHAAEILFFKQRIKSRRKLPFSGLAWDYLHWNRSRNIQNKSQHNYSFLFGAHFSLQTRCVVSRWSVCRVDQHGAEILQGGPSYPKTSLRCGGKLPGESMTTVIRLGLRALDRETLPCLFPTMQRVGMSRTGSAECDSGKNASKPRRDVGILAAVCLARR